MTARLKASASKFAPPTIALISPVSFSIADQRGVGADAAKAPVDGLLGGRLQLGIDGRLDGKPAEDEPGPVAVDEPLREPAREVRLIGVGPRRVDLVLVGDRRADGLLVLRLRDRLLLAHPLEHQVVPLGRSARILERVVATRRRDHSRQQRGLRRRHAGGLAAFRIELGLGGRTGAERRRLLVGLVAVAEEVLTADSTPYAPLPK